MAIFYDPDIEVWYVPEERTGHLFDEYSESGWYCTRKSGPVLGPFGSEEGAVAAARKLVVFRFADAPQKGK
jgi:hypothetical protein